MRVTSFQSDWLMCSWNADWQIRLSCRPAMVISHRPFRAGGWREELGGDAGAGVPACVRYADRLVSDRVILCRRRCCHRRRHAGRLSRHYRRRDRLNLLP